MDDAAGQTGRRTVAVVPHTHWDREWYLPFQTFRLRLVELLDDLLPKLETDPSYAHFLLDGQLAVVDDHLAVRPGDIDRLRRLNTAGRIAVGPWYTLPDEFLVSGETLIRDLQLGFDTAALLGGAMEVGYLPDMFGHIAQMPQLLRLFGIADAVVWRGVPSAVDRTSFRWVAPDGSEVRAEYLPTGYGNGARVPHEPEALVEQIDEFAMRHDTLLDGGPVLWMNGTDHLLPQPWLGEVAAKANASQDRWQIEVTGLAHYLREMALPLTAESPTWSGELRSGARANLLMGVTSNRVDVRRAAARAERALEQLAEPASALFLPADRWPDRLLAEAWLEVIRNAAHDSVCACSDDEVVDTVLHRYAQARQIGEGLADRAIEVLGATVDHDGPVVVNLAPRPRGGIVEIIVDGDEDPDGCQILHRRPAETDLSHFPTTGLAAGIVAELEYVTRYTAASIVDDATGEVLFATSRVGGGRLVGPDDRAVLERLMAADEVRPVTVRVQQQPGRKVLARVQDVPGYGWQGWRPAPAADDPAPVTAVASATGARLTNGLVTVDGASFRLVYGGDVGDTYNWCPPDGDTPAELSLIASEVVETGPLRGRMRLVHGTGDLVAEHIVELRAGERLVRVESTVHNRRRDHRLRIHLRLPEPASASEAECAFAIVTRGLDAEGGPTEVGLPTFPSRRFVRAGGLTVVHEGLNEYELVGIDDGQASELALTLLRCTGMLSQAPMATRPLPAGPFDRLEGPQLQTTLTLRWGFALGDADPYALVDDAFLPLRATRGGAGLDSAARPSEGAALEVSGAQVSAVRRTPAGGLEVRVFNPTPDAATALLPGRHGWTIDLRGRPGRPFEERLPLRPWEIATVVV